MDESLSGMISGFVSKGVVLRSVFDVETEIECRNRKLAKSFLLRWKDFCEIVLIVRS